MNLKELLKDESKRKIVLLCLYLFMMFVIVLIVRINPGNAEVLSNDIVTKTDDIKDNVSALDKLKYTNYQYEYNISDGIESYTLKGTRYNKEEILETAGTNYYLKDNNLYQVNENKLVPVDLNDLLYKLRSENIYDEITNKTPFLELSINGITTKEYIIKQNEINKKIKTYEEDNTINKIEYIEDNLNITIIYTNIGKVTKLNTNFMEE